MSADTVERAAAAPGAQVLVGLTLVTVTEVWTRGEQTLLRVTMPSGRPMLYEPSDVFDPASVR